MKTKFTTLLSVAFTLVLVYSCKKETVTETVTVNTTDTLTVVKYAPKITLNGSNSMMVLLFSTYVEPGATATDKEDGNLTSSIVISGNINTGTVGNYTFTYRVSDSDGNKDSAFRVVHVVADSIAPQLTLVGANPLTLSLNSTYTEPGFVASDNIQGNLNSSVVVSGTINNNLVGTYTLSYTVADNSGNSVNLSRTVIVKNDADYLVGNYFINEINSVGGTYTFYQNVTTSPTINNRIIFSKFADYINNTAMYADVSGSVLGIGTQTANGIGSPAPGCNYTFSQNGQNTQTIALVSGKWKFSINCTHQGIGGGAGCSVFTTNWEEFFTQQ